MNVEHCLDRIDYDGPTEPNIQTLRSLQRALLLTVPYENLDIHLGREIVLSSEAVFAKIVRQGRGGVCYERHILFFDLLTALGFQVEYLSARMIKGAAVGPEYDHMVLLVKLEHDFLVDVGNGHFCREPLRIDGRNASYAEGCAYRVGVYKKDHALYSRHADTEWAPRFLFTMTSRLCSEFDAMNRFHQTSPESPFRRRRLVSIATEEGRIAMIDRRLIVKTGKGKQWSELGSEREYQACLKRYFGIQIPV